MSIERLKNVTSFVINLLNNKTMNDLPAIGYRAMRKELWDRQLANIACRWKEIYGEKLFRRPKTGILEEDQHFSVVVLSEMDLGNVEMRKM